MRSVLAKLLFCTALVLLAGSFDALAEVRERNLYWAPEAATVGAKKIDTLLNFIFYLTAAVFVLTQSVYIYYLVKYRKRPGSKAYYSHGNNKLEIIWTAIPTAIFLGLVSIVPFFAQAVTDVQSVQVSAAGLLIVVGVVLDTMRQIEAQMMMRNYEGFIS